MGSVLNVGSVLSRMVDAEQDSVMEESGKAWKHLFAAVQANHALSYYYAREKALEEHPGKRLDEMNWEKEAYEKQKIYRQEIIAEITAGLDKLEVPALYMVAWVVNKCVEHEEMAKIIDPDRKKDDDLSASWYQPDYELEAKLKGLPDRHWYRNFAIGRGDDELLARLAAHLRAVDFLPGVRCSIDGEEPGRLQFSFDCTFRQMFPWDISINEALPGAIEAWEQIGAEFPTLEIDYVARRAPNPECPDAWHHAYLGRVRAGKLERKNITA
jgi:hypothetical protein